MAYTIFNTRNNEVAVIEDGTIDNTTDLKLIGKNYAGYGEIQNENFVYLLENFASANKPPRPVPGQLWFDTASKKIKVYDGNAERVFVPLGNLHIGSIPSGNAITANNVNKGDLWWDDVTNQLYMHNGAVSGNPFVLIGPQASSDVLTDIIEATVFDNLLVDGDPSPQDHQHKILKGFVDNKVIFIMSNDEFTLDDSNAIAGFDRIKKGITLVNTENSRNGVTADNYNFWGSASNALRLGGTLAQEFVQRSNPVFVTEVSIADPDGLLIGANNQGAFRIDSGEVELVSNVNNGKLNFKVRDGAGTSYTPLTLTPTGPQPITDNNFDLGSLNRRWNEVYAVNFRGIADNANNLLSEGTYRAASKAADANTVATRDSVGDLYATKFRGVAVQSDDSTRANTLRVADLNNTFYGASVATANNTIPVRDNFGNVTANQFNGIATRAIRVQVPTGVDQFEYRAASVADQNIEPNTVAVRDGQGRLHASQFVGSLVGGASAASQLAVARNITIAGDMSGTVSFDGSQDVTINVSATTNAVALGVDTTGNYVQGVQASVGENYLNVRVNNVLGAGPTESALITLDLDASTGNDANTLVARDVYGNFIGNEITAVTRLIGNVNSVGTSNNGWFNNLTVGTLNVTNFTLPGLLPVNKGGTNANNATDARTNLSVYSKQEIDTIVTNINSAIGGIQADRIVSGSSSSQMLASSMVVTINGAEHSTFNSAGINLAVGKFVGTASTAEYADLAENYTTEDNLQPGTVVMVCDHVDHELAACTSTGFPVGVVSTNPAYLMNAGLTNGQPIALKGRVPTRVVGAVKKGDLLFAGANGCAVKEGVYKVAVALESNSDEGEKLVECMLVL